jgi:hypothetical protein
MAAEPVSARDCGLKEPTMAIMSPHGSAVTLTAGEGRTEATLILRL